jgi:hypothetical protein
LASSPKSVKRGNNKARINNSFFGRVEKEKDKTKIKF